MIRERSLSRLEARRFLRRAHLLDARAPDIASAIRHHGYVQIDPINVCGRMHDLILRNRVSGYQEGGLNRHIHGDVEGEGQHPSKRGAFEHHLPSTSILVAFPLESWPHLQSAMLARTRRTGAWSGRLTPREKEFSARILERFAGEGVLGPEDFEHVPKGRSVWGSATLAKSTLQKMFFHGRLLIAARQSNRRLYDLPERVLPPSILALPESAPADVARWLALTRIRQHRLVALKKAEVPLVEDMVERIRIEGCPALHCLSSDLPLLDARPDTAAEALLLAPLDPMIYDRRVTRALWDFDYTWEVYTPPAKRKRGYY
ncbi:MAG TPA: crosslink repair DNA glycosylase YcaQ family protein, partial [Opitutaceae bacterium]